MDFELTEAQSLIQTTARDYASRVIAKAAPAIDRDERIPPEVLRGLAELGMMGVNVPAALGGAEAGAVAYALAMMEVGSGCASTAITMAVTNMVGEVISRFGSDAQRDLYVPRLTSGEYPAGAFALSEPEAGSDAGGLRAVAARTEDGFVLNGAKSWITSGSIAGIFVVWARTGDPVTLPGHRGISCFLVERNNPGLQIGKPESKMGLRGSSTVQVQLDNCRVPEGALLGDLHQGFRIAMMALDGGRIGVSAQAIGIATAALDEAVAYARERRQFGRPIADFQAIQWMLADSRTELDAARMLCLRAASLKEAGRPFSTEAAMSKVFSTEAAGRICDRALQVHGGYGYVREFAAERHVRDVRVTRIYEGTSEVQRVVISRALLE